MSPLLVRTADDGAMAAPGLVEALAELDAAVRAEQAGNGDRYALAMRVVVEAERACRMARDLGVLEVRR